MDALKSRGVNGQGECGWEWSSSVM
jgi:hypothetical protein